MSVLFLGEGTPEGPARYLSAVLTWAKIPFDHRPDQSRLPQSWRKKNYRAILLSDYRYAAWTPCAKEWLMQEVLEKGTGLLMIGGWASFTGLVGKYGGTEIGTLLPVTCVTPDDRVQKATGALLVPSPHRLPEGRGPSLALPLQGEGGRRADEGMPLICGYHRAIPKPGTQVTHHFRDVIYKKGRVSLGAPQPALVLGQAGRARTAAFLTDCAPHWAGGLVDWGRERQTVTVKKGVAVEVGMDYLRFFKNLVMWVGGYSSLSRNDGVSSK